MPMLSEVFGQFAMNLVGQLPLLAVWVAGAVLAAVYWQRDPRAGLLLLLACIISLLLTLVFSVIYIILPYLMRNGMNVGLGNVRIYYTALGFIRSSLEALAWVLVLIAIFRKRPAA